MNIRRELQCAFSVGHSDVREPLLEGDLRRVQLAISLFRKYATFAHTVDQTLNDSPTDRRPGPRTP